MKYCYVLSADEPALYWRMTCLSCQSVRFWDPQARVTLLIDSQSQRALQKAENIEVALDNTFDEVRVIDVPRGSATLRSRHLKTGMRSFIDGDFLFLDADTVVCGNLSAMTAGDADLSAVSDQHRDSSHLADIEEDVFAACGWRKPSRYNLNSGVLYWRDTPGAHRLANLYREKWEASRRLTGRHNDQLALSSAIEDLSANVCELPASYNAQVGLRPETAFGARIWHIFSTDRHRVPHMATIFEDIWDGTEAIGDGAALAPLLRRPHPFMARDRFDRMVISLLRRRRNTADNLPFNDWRRLWLAGDRRSAARALTRMTFSAGSKRVRAMLFGLRSPLEARPESDAR